MYLDMIKIHTYEKNDLFNSFYYLLSIISCLVRGITKAARRDKRSEGALYPYRDRPTGWGAGGKPLFGIHEDQR